MDAAVRSPVVRYPSSQASGNGTGILKIGRKGRRKVQFGEDGTPFEIDVIHVMNLWSAVDLSFRDEKFEIAREKYVDLQMAAWAFVANLGQPEGVPPRDISLAEALEFLNVMRQESEKLKSFFASRSEGGPSSPEPTTVRFST